MTAGLHGPASWREVPDAAARLASAAWRAREGETCFWCPSLGKLASHHPRDSAVWYEVRPRYVFTEKRGSFVQPNAATVSLGGALLGGLAGAGTGWIVKKMLPDSHFDEEESRLPMLGAILGAGAGALPGLGMGAVASTMTPEARKGSHPFLYSPFTRPAGSPPDLPDPKEIEARNLAMAAPGARKMASFMGSESFSPIPVDAFGNVVWDSVAAAPNPWGTRSQYGSATDPMEIPKMATPPAVAALVTGALQGAGALSGKEQVTWPELATTLAASTGAGFAASSAAAKGLGVLAGLRPDAQKSMINAGTFGGLLYGLTRSLF